MIFNSDSNSCIHCNSEALLRFNAIASDSTEHNLIDIVECKSCHFAWQFPLHRTESDSRSFFLSAYKEKNVSATNYFQPEHKKKISQLELGFVTSLSCSPGKLLDIGAGAGIFAQVAAHDGWTVTAIDPALTIEDKEPSTNPRFICGSLADLDQEDMYDVITLWDVIEHSADPLALVQEAYAHLNSGGWLVVETGNYKSADRVGGGLAHWIYQLDHRWYFSPESVGNLLTSIGMTSCTICPSVLRPDLQGDSEFAGPSRLHLIRNIVKDPLRSIQLVQRHMNLLKASKWKNAGLWIFAIAAQKSRS